MKKIYLISVMLLILLGCDNSIDPIGTYREELVFFSILRGNDSVQTALLYKTSPPSADGKPQNIPRDYVKDALIRIWAGDDTVMFFKFNDGKYDTSRIPENAYYTEDFIPEPDKEYRVEAVLKDGRRVSSEISTPPLIQYAVDLTKRMIPQKLPTGKYSEEHVLAFKDLQADGLYILNSASILYKVKINGVVTNKQFKLPDFYQDKGGKKVPVFYEPSFENVFKIKTQTLIDAFKIISDSEPDNAQIVTQTILIEGIIYNRELTAYYVSNNKLGTNFSVTIDEFDYTNIRSGIGLFASFGVGHSGLIFEEAFIKSLNLPKVKWMFDN